MKQLFRLVFLSMIISFSFSAYSQSLTLQSFGSPSVTDVLQSSNLNASARGVVLDVHEASGISVYVWTEPDNVSLPSGNHDIYCALYDKNMIQIQTTFLINLNTSGDQVQPAIKINQMDNTFIVVWASNHGTDGQYDVYAKKINLYTQNVSLVAATTDNLINTDYTTLRQQTPKLAYDYTYDEVIIGWRDGDGQDGNGTGVYARRVSNTNFPAFPTSQFLVNQTTTNNQVIFDMEVSPITGSLYVLYSSISATTGTDIFTRRYNRNASDGSYTALSETMRNVTTTGEQWNPGFKFNRTTGSYVISWNSDYQDGSGRGIYFKVYDQADASLTGEIRGSIPTANAQFTLRTAWDEESGYLMQLYVYNGGAVTIKYQLFDNTFATVGSETDALSGTNIVYSDAYYSIAYSQQSKNLYLNYIVFSGTDVGKTYARYFKYSNPAYAPPVCTSDNTKNWTSQSVYDQNGNKVKEQRTYYDQLGRTVQVQSRDFENKNTLATATLYDHLGKPAIQTLPATTNNQCLLYKNDLVTYLNGASYSSYTFNQFDATGTGSGSVNNSVAVASNTGVGLYYSSSNTAEPYVATSAYPYYRSYTNKLVSNGVDKSSNPGEDLKLGTGKEMKSFTAPLLNELDHYLGLRNNYFAASGSALSTLAYQGTKTITIDENGVESIVFNDKSSNTLAKAICDGTVYTPLSATIAVPTFYYYTYNNTTGANVTLDLSNVKELLDVYDFTTASGGTMADGSIVVTNGHIVQVRSKETFNIKVTTSSSSSFVLPTKVEDVNHPAALDFYINNYTSLSLTGDANAVILITDAETGATVYSGVKSGFSSVHTNGFYRIRFKTPAYSQTYSSPTLVVNYTINYSNFSYYFYDNAGRKVAEVAPNSLVAVAPNGINSVATTSPLFKTVYSFNTIGLTLSKNDLDESITNFVYRKDGSPRFTQNAKQATSGKFSYINYDVATRALETGEYDNTLGTLVFQTHASYVTSPNVNSVFTVLESMGTDGGMGSSCTCRTQKANISYDIVSSSMPTAPTNIPVARTQTFLSGMPSMSSNDNNTTWYSYDEFGRTSWTVQNIIGLGYKTTDYQYDLNGNVLKTIYQDATTERFEHRNTYDKNQRLKLVETRPGTGPYQTEEKTYYCLNGKLKRRELAIDLQGIDYVYTIQGWLKSINSPNLDATDPGGDKQTGAHSNFASDVFGMMLEYYTGPSYVYPLGEYGQFGNKCGQALNNSHITTTNVTDKFDGTVKAMRWQTKGQPIGTNPSQYVFEYDKKYQLKTATFGSVAPNATNCSTGGGWFYEFTANASNAFKVQTINYDANGNLLSKYTNNNLGASSDPFSYNYITNTNRLQSVQNSGSTYYAQYQYNAIGQMVKQTQGTTPALVDTIEYNAYGLMSKVTETFTGVKIQSQILYNELGYRIQKKSYSTAGSLLYTTYYVNDAAGNVMSIYDNNGTSLAQKEIPVYGTSGRIGVAYKTSSYSYQYEIGDHLGNVRAVINRLKSTGGTYPAGEAYIANWKDVYPHGAIMPTRTGTGSQRNDYQGQFSEKDLEGGLGYNAFELRMYDAKIGRWLSPDPMGQYWTPYLAMGNNHVSLFDPTGGDDSYAGGMGGGAQNGGGPNGGGYYGYGGGSKPTPPKFADVSYNFSTQWGGGGNGINYNPAGNSNSGGGNYTASNYSGPTSSSSSACCDGMAKWVTDKLKAGDEWAYGEGGKAFGTVVAGVTGASTWANIYNKFAGDGKDIITGGNVSNTGLAIEAGLSILPIKFGGVAKAGTSVLGKYPTYVKLAEQLGAKRFSIPTNVWNKMSATQQWAANQKFLDRIISRGDIIILSNPVLDINTVSGAFREELNYLISKGYRLNSSGTQLIK